MSYPRYVPDFNIKINDKEIPAAVRASITGILYQDGMQEADRVEIELANTNLRWLQTHIRGLGFRPFPTGVKIGPIRALEAAPDGTFDLDNKLSLSIGYVVPRIFGIEDRQAIASSMEIGIHNSTLAITIAVSLLDNVQLAVPAAVYGVLMFPLAAAFGAAITRKSRTMAEID